MTIGFRGVGALTESAANSIAPALPGGWQAGDFALCIAMTRGNATLNDITTPQTWTGLTQVSKTTSLRARMYWRILQTGDGNPRVTASASQCFLGFIAAWTQVHQNSPFDASHTVASGTAVNSAMTAPDLTVTTTKATVLRVFASGDDNCHTTPSVGSLVAGGASYDSTQGADGALSLVSQPNVNAGAIGTMTVKQNSNANDDYIAFTLALHPYDAVISSDALFMNDVGMRLSEHNFKDGVLFGAGTKNVIWDGVLRDLMFLYDTSSAFTGGGGAGPVEYTRAVTDYLFLFDLRTQRALEKIDTADRLFLKDVRMAVRDLFATRDNLFVKDSSAPSTERPRSATDKILLGDGRLSEQEHRQQDKTLTSDRRIAEQEHRVTSDNLFLSDTRSQIVELLRKDSAMMADQLYRESLRMAMDKLLTAERLVEDREKTSRDAMLFRDYRTAEQERRQTDKVLLGDSWSRDAGKLVSMIDGLFLRDESVRETSRFFADKLLVKDTRMTLLERRIAESVLLGETAVRLLERLLRDGLYLQDATDVAKAGVIIRHMVDYLFLFDAVALQTPVQSITMTDKLLLGDRTLRDLSRRLVESLLVKDNRVSALESVKRDALMAGELTIKVHEHRLLDTALLSDAALLGKGIVREVLDKIILLDRRLSERGLTAQDVALLGDVARRVRELLNRDNLLLPDSAATAWFPFVMEYLTYARTAVLALMGVETRGVDLLGRRIGADDLLGRDIGATRSRIE